MTLFVTSVVAGLTIGSIYGLIGIGFTIIFNATRVFNLAQGDLVMVGVMTSFYLLDSLKMNELVAFVLVIIFVSALAAFEEQTVVRPFLKKTGGASFGWFIATLGFAATVEAVVDLLFGDHAIVAIPSPVPVTGFRIGSIVIGYRQLLVIGTFLVVVVILDVFYNRTWLGHAMRATAEDREGAGYRGINPVTMSRTAFIMAGVVAAIAGFVIAPITFSDPSIGINFTLDGFLALAIGGFGSVRGAVAGGLLLGVCQQLFDTYVNSNYEIVVGLVLLLLVLLFRPEGLFRSQLARTV